MASMDPRPQQVQIMVDPIDQARREGALRADVDAHEQRLNQINGNIARLSDAVVEVTRKVDRRIDGLGTKVDGIAEQIRTADAIGHALATQATAAIEEAKSQAIGRKELILAVAAIVGALGAVIPGGLLFVQWITG